MLSQTFYIPLLSSLHWQFEIVYVSHYTVSSVFDLHLMKIYGLIHFFTLKELLGLRAQAFIFRFKSAPIGYWDQFFNINNFRTRFTWFEGFEVETKSGPINSYWKLCLQDIPLKLNISNIFSSKQEAFLMFYVPTTNEKLNLNLNLARLYWNILYNALLLNENWIKFID